MVSRSGKREIDDVENIVGMLNGGKPIESILKKHGIEYDDLKKAKELVKFFSIHGTRRNLKPMEKDELVKLLDHLNVYYNLDDREDISCDNCGKEMTYQYLRILWEEEWGYGAHNTYKDYLVGDFYYDSKKVVFCCNACANLDIDMISKRKEIRKKIRTINSIIGEHQVEIDKLNAEKKVLEDDLKKLCSEVKK